MRSPLSRRTLLSQLRNSAGWESPADDRRDHTHTSVERTAGADRTLAMARTAPVERPADPISPASRLKRPGGGACYRSSGRSPGDRGHGHRAGHEQRLEPHRGGYSVDSDQRRRRKRTIDAVAKMTSNYSQPGWRVLTSLAFCGAAAGFIVPAIGSSLVQQEKRQPAVRLLPAPRLPASETEPSLPGGRPDVPPPAANMKPLRISKLEQQELRQFQRDYRAEIKRATRGASGPVVSPTPYTPTPAPPAAPANSNPPKSTSGKQPGSTEKQPKTSTGSGDTGGTESHATPTTRSPHK
jgi:hypothetical protein